MRFRLTQNAFINIPTNVVDGEISYTKSVATRITHEDGSPISASAPRDMDFPASLPLDSISRTWEALDGEAKAAQAKLGKMGNPDSKAAPTAAAVLSAFSGLSADERAKVLATVAPAKIDAAKVPTK